MQEKVEGFNCLNYKFITKLAPFSGYKIGFCWEKEVIDSRRF